LVAVDEHCHVVMMNQFYLDVVRHHLATHSKKSGVKIPIPRHKKDIPIGIGLTECQKREVNLQSTLGGDK